MPLTPCGMHVHVDDAEAGIRLHSATALSAVRTKLNSPEGASEQDSGRPNAGTVVGGAPKTKEGKDRKRKREE